MGWVSNMLKLNEIEVHLKMNENPFAEQNES